MKGNFICIIGIDGSGKTTLTKNLIQSFEREGYCYTYEWAKFESSLLKAVIFLKNSFFVRGNDQKTLVEKNQNIKNKLFQNTVICFFYESFVTISYFFQMFIRITIPLKNGKNIICDRYLYDTLVDLAYDLKYDEKKIRERTNLYLKYLPHPDVLIYLKIPEEIALKRKDDIPSYEFISEKRKIYEKILKILGERNNNYFEVEGTDSPEIVTRNATGHINEVIKV